jgi:hypothetical protein
MGKEQLEPQLLRELQGSHPAARVYLRPLQGRGAAEGEAGDVEWERGEASMMASVQVQPQPLQISEKQKRRIVDMYGYTWGRQYRRHFGADALFPIASLLGRVKEEAEAAGERGSVDRHYPEVFTGDALDFARAWRQLREFDRETAMVHYVIVGLVKQKCEVWGCEERTYHQRRKIMQIAMVPLLGL